MSKPTALQVMRIALQQYAYTEKPAGSNKTKFGAAFGMNGEPWCAEYSWWCGWKAAGENQKNNPIAKSASAAYIEDLTVAEKDGKYILKQTANNKKKEAALPKVKFGDEISFNFNGGNSRQHTALVVSRWGNYYWCIEGNTSFSEKGSQSNGGCVALRERYYTTGVCIVRPDYTPFTFPYPKTEYKGKTVKLPARGWYEYGDKNAKVAALQEALSWANGYKLKPDGELGGMTFAEVVIFQVFNGLEPDGQFGEDCLAKLNKLIKTLKTPQNGENGDLSGDNSKIDTNIKEPEKTVKSKNTLLYERAKRDAYAYGTTKSKYKYPEGHAKEEYRKDLNKAYPDRSGWGVQTRAGASCDVFVGTVVRASGVDPHFPRGLDEVEAYVKKHPEKWVIKHITDRNDMKKGDLIFQLYNGGGGHIAVYMGGNRVANAHYVGKTYPIIQAYTSVIHKKSSCKKFFVIRPKG